MSHLKRVLITLACFIITSPVYAIDIRGDMEKICSDGNERLVAYTVDGTLTDLSLKPSATSVDWNDEKFFDMCTTNDQMVVVHCHTLNDVMSSFPSSEIKGNKQSDIGLLINQEFLCARAAHEAKKEKTNLVHALYDIPRKTFVTYKVTSGVQNKVELIAEQNVNIFQSLVGQDLLGLVGNMQEHLALIEKNKRDYGLLVADVNENYYNLVVRYVKEKECGFIDEKNTLSEGCNSININDFASFVAQEDTQVIIQPYYGKEPQILISSKVVEEKKAFDVSEYPGVYLLTTPNEFEEYISKGKSILFSCGGKDGLSEQECTEQLRQWTALAGECSDMKVGVIDTENHPSLATTGMFSGEINPPKIQFYEEGFRGLITFYTHTELKNVQDILCGVL